MNLSQLSDEELAKVKHDADLAYCYAFIQTASVEELLAILDKIEQRQAATIETTRRAEAEAKFESEVRDGKH